MKLDNFLNPKSIAVVGATERQGAFGYNAAVNVLKSKDKARVYFVNNRKKLILGRKAYSSLSELPEVVDCVLIATPRDAVLGVFEEAAKLGIKAAIIYASGFGEENSEEGKDAELKLMELYKKYNLPYMGPNCIGLTNNVDKMMLLGVDDSGFDMEHRGTGIGLIAQSGSVCMNAMKSQYINLSYIFSTGNGNVVTVDEVLNYCVDSNEVKVIAMYLEGIKDSVLFIEALKKAAAKKKPIVILKSGKSIKGAAATASHTGNMAGSGKSYEAIFDKYGVISVDSVYELLETSHLLTVISNDMPKNKGFAYINSSGGENAVCTDLCEKYGIELPQLTEITKEKLGKILPSYGTASNPLDQTVTMNSELDGTKILLNTITDDESFSAIVVGSQASFYADEDVEEYGDCVGTDKLFDNSWVRYKKQNRDTLPMLIAPPYAGVSNLIWRKNMEHAGIGILAGGETSYKQIKSIEKYLDFCKHNVLKEMPDISIPTFSKENYASIALSESESKNVLAEYGVPVPKQGLAKTVDEIENIVTNMEYPLVLKIDSPDILHKSDVGGVSLRIMSLYEAKVAFMQIMENCKKHEPNAVLNGILIQEMAPSGVEMIIGISNDIIFGPMLLVGIGGISVEIYKDISMAPCPINKTGAFKMIQSLRGYKLLNGFRGNKPCDINSLAELMVNISLFASERKDSIKEMDINPVIVYEEGKGVIAVDAVIVEYTK